MKRPASTRGASEWACAAPPHAWCPVSAAHPITCAIWLTYVRPGHWPAPARPAICLRRMVQHLGGSSCVTPPLRRMFPRPNKRSPILAPTEVCISTSQPSCARSRHYVRRNAHLHVQALAPQMRGRRLATPRPALSSVRRPMAAQMATTQAWRPASRRTRGVPLSTGSAPGPPQARRTSDYQCTAYGVLVQAAWRAVFRL